MPEQFFIVDRLSDRELIDTVKVSMDHAATLGKIKAEMNELASSSGFGKEAKDKVAALSAEVDETIQSIIHFNLALYNNLLINFIEDISEVEEHRESISVDQ